MRPRRDGNADLQPGVSRYLHVLFPFGIAGKARLAVAGVTGRGRPALGSASNGESFQQLAIQPGVELLRPPHALDVVLILPLKTNLDEVDAVDRKVVMARNTATRPERQVFAFAIVLYNVQGNLVRLDRRMYRRETCGEPGDLTGR